MLLKDMHILFVCVGKGSSCTEAFLLPEDGDAASDGHVSEEEILADEDLFCLYKIGGIEVVVDASAIVPGPRHEFASPADETVVKGKVFGLAEEFPYVPLDDRHFPALRYLFSTKHHEHVLVPAIFPFCHSLLVYFLGGQGQIAAITKIKVVLDDVVIDVFEDL
jgi:hypothetical protein